MKVLKSVQKKSKGNPKHLVSSETSHTASQVYCFGSFCLNQAERLLLRNGHPIRLTPKVFDVLLLLIQNSGCLVTKDKFLKEVWSDTFVEEANLSVNIASLRKALDEGGAERQYIQTVIKGGYRFVASVAELSDESAGTVDARLPEEPFMNDGNNVSERDQVLNSLAVLPFDHESRDPDGEYLSAGLTESIINSLSQFHNLRVMARDTVNRYQGKDKAPRTVGQELGVRSVLTGRILRLGDKLIIRTELVDVMNGWQLWGEQYQTKVSDILVVQEEMAKEISQRLRIKLTAQRPLSIGMSRVRDDEPRPTPVQARSSAECSSKLRRTSPASCAPAESNYTSQFNETTVVSRQSARRNPQDLIVPAGHPPGRRQQKTADLTRSSSQSGEIK